MPLAEYQADVLLGERVTRHLATEHQRPLRFFRHPFLHTGRDLDTKNGFETFLSEHGYRVAPVTIDNGEWIYARAYDLAIDQGDDETARRIEADYLDYMIRVVAYYEKQSAALLGYELPQILLIHASRLNGSTLDRMLTQIEQRGYRFIHLHEALEDPAYRSPDTYTGPGGITWLHRWALTAGKRGEFFAGEPEVSPWVRTASNL